MITLKKILKYDYYIITSVCALLIISSIYILQNVAPFGEHSLLTIDFFHQYGPMLGELYTRITKGLNLIYSFNMGMGLPFFRNFFNYLSSPFNIILLLFKQKDLLMSYSVIIGLKAIASAITMSIFLNKKFGKNYIFISLSLLYAFSAYFTAYYWNIMWLDGMVMLPLVALGIERLVNNNKILLYVISLSVMLFSNYFIGYMICIFCVLYFIATLIIKTDKINIKSIFKKILYFGLSSLIAGGICALFLIPLYFALKGISATNDIWPTSQYYDFTIKEFLFNHFSGVGSTVLKSGITCAPNISCGVISIALLFVFWISPNINFKTKVIYSLLLLFLFSSFIIAPLDFIWHAFHVPNDLPYRYSFIYTFIFTIISAYGIKNIKDIKPIWIGIIYIIVLGFITLMKVYNFENINTDMLILNYAVITIFYLCYIIYTYFNKFFKAAILIAIITATLECIIVVNNNWYIDQNIDGFYSDYKEIANALDFVKNNDSGMYRIERLNLLTFNDPSWYGYYGQTAFSSMEYENMATMQYHLGMPGNEINSFYYKKNTPVYDLMFNIKYLIGDASEDYYSLFYSTDQINVYKSNYNLGLMFPVNQEVEYFLNYSDSPIENQNDFMINATGISVFDRITDYEVKTVYYNNDKTIVRYRLNNNFEDYYIYTNNYDVDFLIVDNNLYYRNDDYSYINEYTDINISFYESYNEKYIISKKTDKKYFDIYVGYSNYYDDGFEIYTLNKDNFEKAFDYLNDNKVIINEFNEKNIKATANINNDRLIYTSIPFDDGWEVYVDNKLVESKKIANTLLAFDLPAGNHNIELKYHIPYFKIGLLISIVSLSGLVILVKYKKD